MKVKQRKQENNKKRRKYHVIRTNFGVILFIQYYQN